MTYLELVFETKTMYPKFDVVSKRDSALMKACDVLLWLITFGGMKTFMTNFTTVIGYVVYVPDNWSSLPEDTRALILRHERVHMQQRKASWFFSLKYLLLPFPVLWAYYRTKYEMEAYEESMRFLWELRGVKAFTPEYRANMISNFTGAGYFWMWPWRKRIEKWYDGFVARMQG